jgi:hypothetical protein
VPVLLIELDKAAVADAALQMRRGADPFEICGGLWTDHDDLACLICDAPAGDPPFTMISPSRHPTVMIAAPLCPKCADLPPMLRMHRGERMLRKMWSKPGGKQCHLR